MRKKNAGKWILYLKIDRSYLFIDGITVIVVLPIPLFGILPNEFHSSFFKDGFKIVSANWVHGHMKL